jgi:magnesium-transporting ATPase (P-type)
MVESDFSSTPDWHLLDVGEVFEKVQSDIEGLSEDEAAERLKEFGRNSLPEREPPGIATIFLHQFFSPLIYILLAAGSLSLLIGEITDAIFIFAVILLNAGLGTFQEWKAEKSAAALQNLLRIFARIRRRDKELNLPGEELVPGDIVFLESGNLVPADLRMITVKNLALDESLLTGESQAVNKESMPLEGELPLAERSNMAFAGSTVASGRGIGVVVATGLSTELGRIARAVTETEPTKPPLVIRMERFARQISFIALGVIALLALILLLRGASYTEVFFMAVALAVSAIPEGLPVAMTVALSIATSRMARRNVIVRKLTAVESLGSCTCIASDKTGTLTVNKQTAKLIGLPGGQLFAVTGEGYSGVGMVLTPEGEEPSPAARLCLGQLVSAAVLCNEARLDEKDGRWEHNGDAVDVALLTLGYKMGLYPGDLRSAVKNVGEIPFESEHRYAASFYRDAEGLGVSVKGAVEAVIHFCVDIQTEGGEEPLNPETIGREALALAEGGYRVIAVASGRLADQADLTVVDEKIIPPLTFLGLIGLIDPLRHEVKESINCCRKAGVKVVMVTGDHPATALSIACELGIAGDRRDLVTGSQLEKIGSPVIPQYLEVVKNASVFSRVAPLQKLDIVEALGMLGHFVAVTGDGVNDAPALRRANIGVAMGSGTDVAKDVASIIVTDDNFASIEAGVEEGRFAYDNIRKVVYLLISTGGAEIILFFLALLAGLPLPLVAVQLLWLNLVTNGIQDVALAFEGGEPGSMERPPRPPTEGVFNRLMIEQTIVAGVCMGLLAFANWYWLMSLGWDLASARNSTLLLLVLLENVQAFNCRSERISVFRVPLSRNWLLVAGVALAQGIHILSMNIPFMRKVLGVAPVSFSHWLMLTLFALPLIVAMELFKRYRSGAH